MLSSCGVQLGAVCVRVLEQYLRALVRAAFRLPSPLCGRRVGMRGLLSEDVVLLSWRCVCVPSIIETLPAEAGTPTVRARRSSWKSLPQEDSNQWYQGLHSVHRAECWNRSIGVVSLCLRMSCDLLVLAILGIDDQLITCYVFPGVEFESLSAGLFGAVLNHE